jgi:accessory gene regulator B
MIKIEAIAESIALSVKRNYPDSSSVEVLKMGLVAGINLLITVFLVLGVSAITGDIKSGLVAVIGFPMLRYFSGGIHLKSSHLCNVITSTMMLLSIYMRVEYWYNGFIITIITILLLLIYAPSGIKRSRLGKEHYPKLKLIAILIVSSNFLLQSHVLTFAFLLQSLTTTTLFQKFIQKIDI